jgi:hypothetical protein
MRVCRAPARDALAAPSSFVQLLNQLFFQMGKGLTSINAESFSTTAIEPSIAQPSPASVNTYFSTANITRGLRSPSAAS